MRPILRNTRVQRAQPVYEPEIIPGNVEMTRIVKNLTRDKVAEKCAFDLVACFHLTEMARTNRAAHHRALASKQSGDTKEGT